jgi:hypothetical protein
VFLAILALVLKRVTDYKINKIQKKIKNKKRWSLQMLDLSFALIRDPGSGVTKNILVFIKSDKNGNNSDILKVEEKNKHKNNFQHRR